VTKIQFWQLVKNKLITQFIEMTKTNKSIDLSEPRIAYEAPKMEAIQIEIENVLLDSTSVDSYGANDGSYYGRG
jgi:hypothetical protein